MKIHSRREWGARPAASAASNTLNHRSVLYVHWSAGKGLGAAFDTLDEQKAAVRGIQRFHQDGRGWSDIAYGYLIVQPSGRFRRAHIFEGRGFTKIPASQFGHNTGNSSVCVLMAPGEKLKPATVRKIQALYRRFPGERVKGHRDDGGTDCPGDQLYAALPSVRKVRTKLKPIR